MIKRRSSIRFRAKAIFALLIFLIIIVSVSGLYIYIVNVYAQSFISPLAHKRESDVSKPKIEFLLEKNNLHYSRVIASDSSYFVYLDSLEVIFSNKKNIQSQISSLQVILMRFTIEGKRVSRIDFRYSKPIVSTK